MKSADVDVIDRAEVLQRPYCGLVQHFLLSCHVSTCGGNG